MKLEKLAMDPMMVLEAVRSHWRPNSSKKLKYSYKELIFFMADPVTDVS